MGRPTPAEVDRLERLSRLVASAKVPVYGHLQLDTGRRVTDVLLGSRTSMDGGVTVIDWMNAPLAEAFFSAEVGEEYEVQVEERPVSGRLLEKHLLTVEGGRLLRVQAHGRRFLRDGDGRWGCEPAPTVALLPRPPGRRTPFRSPLEVKLDPAQQAAVDLPATSHVLLLGEAGFGKTTVALHRLLALERRSGRAWRGAVIVPTEGLRRLTEMMLLRRGESSVEVFTFERWARELARRAFRGLPRRESQSASSGVVALKRHPALRQALAEYARLDRKQGATREDLELFFGDSRWMDRVVELSRGALGPVLVAQLTAHTRRQFRDAAEHTYAHVDAARLEALDGERLDSGTPDEDANSLDSEDYAVLFELERQRALLRGKEPVPLGKFDCVLVDEGQELAPIELALIRRALRPKGRVIVAGDAAQQVDPTACFTGWDGVLEELGAADAARVTLEVNYRCPPDVTALARSILDPARPAPSPEPSVTRASCDHLFHLVAWLSEQLARLEAEDPSAAIALVCRTKEAARSFAHALRHGAHVRLALDGDFDFRAGVAVTCVPEVKGLEFDLVVVPDAARSTYPATQESRRALYVAVTRATHRLGLACSGEPSPLLRTASPRDAEELSAP